MFIQLQTTIIYQEYRWHRIQTVTFLNDHFYSPKVRNKHYSYRSCDRYGKVYQEPS